MPCFSDDAATLLKNAGKDEVRDSLENAHATILAQRADYVEYGNADELSGERRAKLNCDLLKQVLMHRAERLMTAAGQLLTGKNLYGLALVARGHVETTAVLGYFARRLDSLAKGNIEFAQFEQDIANGLMGAKHDLFDKAKSPVNMLTCVENADKLLDANLFKEKHQILQDLYSWLSEFAHPNFCSNKTAFTLDKQTGRMILRKAEELGDDHYQMIASLDMSSKMFGWLLEDYARRVQEAFSRS